MKKKTKTSKREARIIRSRYFKCLSFPSFVSKQFSHILAGHPKRYAYHTYSLLVDFKRSKIPHKRVNLSECTCNHSFDRSIDRKCGKLFFFPPEIVDIFFSATADTFLWSGSSFFFVVSFETGLRQSNEKVNRTESNIMGYKLR